MTTWISNAEMAAALGIALRTLHKYRFEHDFLIEGRHWRRMTPSANAPIVWDRERTELAWAAETATAGVVKT